MDDNFYFDDEDLGEDEPYLKTPILKSPDGKITLNLISTIGPGQKRKRITISKDIFVGVLKETAGGLFGLNPSDFHLSAEGVTLDEDSILNDYNMFEEETVVLIPKSIAGN